MCGVLLSHSPNSASAWGGATVAGSSHKQLSCEPGAWQCWSRTWGTRRFCLDGAGSLKLSPFPWAGEVVPASVTWWPRHALA